MPRPVSGCRLKGSPEFILGDNVPGLQHSEIYTVRSQQLGQWETKYYLVFFWRSVLQKPEFDCCEIQMEKYIHQHVRKNKVFFFLVKASFRMFRGFFLLKTHRYNWQSIYICGGTRKPTSTFSRSLQHWREKTDGYGGVGICAEETSEKCK